MSYGTLWLFGGVTGKLFIAVNTAQKENSTLTIYGVGMVLTGCGFQAQVLLIPWGFTAQKELQVLILYLELE